MGGAIPNSFVGVAGNTQNPDAAYAFAKFCATYGNKYMYAAGHATTWTGVDPEEIVEVVFGSREEAEKRINVDTFISSVVATGEPALVVFLALVIIPIIMSLLLSFADWNFLSGLGGLKWCGLDNFEKLFTVD